MNGRYLDPAKHRDLSIEWLPGSVPAVVAQAWAKKYKEFNIADNPVHGTIPDLLIGMPITVERRRTKYIAFSR